MLLSRNLTVGPNPGWIRRELVRRGRTPDSEILMKSSREAKYSARMLSIRRFWGGFAGGTTTAMTAPKSVWMCCTRCGLVINSQRQYAT